MPLVNLELKEPGQLIDEIVRLRAALHAILDAEKDFREGMPPEWQGDPLTDACDEARKVIASFSPA